GDLGRAAPRARHAHDEAAPVRRRPVAARAAHAGREGRRGARRVHARGQPRGRVHRHRRPWPRRGRGAAMSASPGVAVPALRRRPRHPGPRLLVQATLARTYVRIVGSLREPTWMISDAIFPNLGMCAFVLLYRALGAPRTYEALAVVGGLLTSYWINVLWGMGAQFFFEKQQGQLQLYFAAPCSRLAILTGMALGGLLATILRSLVGVAIGLWIFHIAVAPFSPWLLAGVFLLTMVALYALGMTLASLFLLYGREAWHTANALQEPVYFLSGL